MLSMITGNDPRPEVPRARAADGRVVARRQRAGGGRDHRPVGRGLRQPVTVAEAAIDDEADVVVSTCCSPARRAPPGARRPRRATSGRSCARRAARSCRPEEAAGPPAPRPTSSSRPRASRRSYAIARDRRHATMLPLVDRPDSILALPTGWLARRLLVRGPRLRSPIAPRLVRRRSSTSDSVLDARLAVAGRRARRPPAAARSGSAACRRRACRRGSRGGPRRLRSARGSRRPRARRTRTRSAGRRRRPATSATARKRRPSSESCDRRRRGCASAASRFSARRAIHSRRACRLRPCATTEHSTTSAARLKIRSPPGTPAPSTSSENVIVATPLGPNQAMNAFVARVDAASRPARSTPRRGARPAA